MISIVFSRLKIHVEKTIRELSILFNHNDHTKKVTIQFSGFQTNHFTRRIMILYIVTNLIIPTSGQRLLVTTYIEQHKKLGNSILIWNSLTQSICGDNSRLLYIRNQDSCLIEGLSMLFIQLILFLPSF